MHPLRSVLFSLIVALILIGSPLPGAPIPMGAALPLTLVQRWSGENQPSAPDLLVVLPHQAECEDLLCGG